MRPKRAERAASQPLSADRELLFRLERAAVIQFPEPSPQWPADDEVAALVLAVALAAKQRAIVAPETVLVRLAALGWLRAQLIRKERDVGVGWIDWNKAARTGALARRAGEIFSERVLKLQLYGCWSIGEPS